MRLRIREIADDAKWGEVDIGAALARVIPQSLRLAVVQAAGVQEQRRRKLPAELMVVWCVALHLFPRASLAEVLAHLLQGLRLLWPDPTFVLATASALCQARQRLGAQAVVTLFHQVCRPLATPQTPGAFAFGWRLVALDSTTTTVPDTPANVRAFGRHTNQSGPVAYPQVLSVYLVECGTHAIIDAGVWPATTSVHRVAPRFLRSLSPELLLLWDRGFHSASLLRAVRDRGVQTLTRLPSTVAVRTVRDLADGTRLVTLNADHSDQPMVFRLLEYTLNDPLRSADGEIHRLLTSLLDPLAYPALDLITLYHERWEIELTIDETDTHLRLPNQPLRSRTPVGVVQERYGLFIAHYACRAVIHDAALAHGLDPDRLSFTRSVHLISQAIRDFQQVVEADHPQLYQRLLDDLVQVRLPRRRNRLNPRVIKCQQSKFPRKRPHHAHPPQPLTPFRDAIALCR